MGRILVAGVGNVLRSDDGFGVRAAQALSQHPHLPPHVEVIETGIGGIGLVHELMGDFDALILLDAFDRGVPPGSVFVLEPQLPDLSRLSAHERRDYFSDTHYATPLRALAFAAALTKLPPVVRIVGCQPERTDEFAIGLTPSVAAAVPRAVEHTLALVAWIETSPDSHETPQRPQDSGA